MSFPLLAEGWGGHTVQFRFLMGGLGLHCYTCNDREVDNKYSSKEKSYFNKSRGGVQLTLTPLGKI